MAPDQPLQMQMGGGLLLWYALPQKGALLTLLAPTPFARCGQAHSARPTAVGNSKVSRAGKASALTHHPPHVVLVRNLLSAQLLLTIVLQRQ